MYIIRGKVNYVSYSESIDSILTERQYLIVVVIIVDSGYDKFITDWPFHK